MPATLASHSTPRVAIGSVKIIDTPQQSHWVGGDLMETLVSPQETAGLYDVMRATVAPGGGPPPHRHSREDELFYVVDGTFEFIHNDRVFTATAGTSVFLPRDSVHTFRNSGATDGTLITFNTPGGFVDFVAEAGLLCANRNARPAVTAASLERLAGWCATYGIELLPAHQPTAEMSAPAPLHDLWVTGLHVRILLGAAQTNGAFAVAEITAHPGDFVPPHTHLHEDEIFYVLDGEVEFDIPGGAVTAGRGTFIHIPKKTLHGFRNASDAPAKLLDLHTPGGFEAFFQASGTPWPDRSISPPPGAWVDVERFISIARAHGMELPQQPGRD